MGMSARYLLEHADEFGERFIWSVDDLVPHEAADILIGADYPEYKVKIELCTRPHM